MVNNKFHEKNIMTKSLFNEYASVANILGGLGNILMLIVNYRTFRNNQSSVKSEFNFKFDSPTSKASQIIIRNNGKGDINLDEIKYYVNPQKLKHKIIHRFLGINKKKIIVYQNIDSQFKIPEGHKGKIEIKLPRGLKEFNIYKAYLIDQTGKCWKIGWPKPKKTKKITAKKELQFIHEDNNNRSCTIAMYQLGLRYCLKLSCTIGTNKDVRLYWFSDKKQCEAQLNKAKSNINNYLDGTFPSLWSV